MTEGAFTKVVLSAEEVEEARYLGADLRDYARAKMQGTLDVFRIFKGDLKMSHPLFDELIGMEL